MSIREIAQTFHNFCPKYIPPLSEFSHCFCPKFSIAFVRISGKSNEKFGQNRKSNWKIWAKAMRKLGKLRHIFRAKIIAFARISNCFFPYFPIAFPRIFYCFFPNFSIAFARISHCFCPNFSLLLPEFFFFTIFWGHSAPLPPPPPPPTPMIASFLDNDMGARPQLYRQKIVLFFVTFERETYIFSGVIMHNVTSVYIIPRC